MAREREARQKRRAGEMLSRLREPRQEEETLLRVKAALRDRLKRLKVEEQTLESVISSREGEEMTHSPLTEGSEHILVQVDNETSINQTELQLSTRNHAQEEEEEEEEEESDS